MRVESALQCCSALPGICQKALADHFQGLTREYRAELRVRTQAGQWLWIIDQGKIFAHSLRTRERRLLHEGGSDGQVLPTGHLVFGNGAVIYAKRFDPKSLTASGTPTPVLEGVRRAPASGAMILRVAANGTMVYVPGTAGSANEPRALAFVDRQSKISPLPIPSAAFDMPRLSPDGTRIAVVVSQDSQVDIWIQDLPVKSALRRLTFSGNSRFPVWSPDGRQIAFLSSRDGGDAIYVQDADVSGASAEQIVKTAAGEFVTPTAWSGDGWLAVTLGKDGGASLHVLSLADRKMVRVAEGPGTVTTGGVFSPDGKWIAYYSLGGTLTTPLTFVQPFPATNGTKYQVGPGIHPAWAAGGRELLVNAPTPREFVVYRFAATPRVAYSAIGAIDRTQLFAVTVGPRQFDPSADGKQLLVMTSPANTGGFPREMRVVQNWRR